MLVHFTTPIFTALGIFRYHSRFLYSVGNSLHIGSSYDLVWKLRGARKRDLLREIKIGYARFLATRPPSARITVETWFLSPRRMERMGFRRETPTFWARLEMAAGYPDMLFSQWLVTRRLRWFNPWKVERYSLSLNS